jgi:four helix bundle protein
MRTPANQTVEGNGQSLRFVAVPHLIVGRRSVHVHSEAVHVLVHETGMQLDHEKLEVYRVSLDFAAWSYERCRTLKGADRHARDQLLRASQSIALNIAEGCGKVSGADRGRFLQIASGSARECGAILDILGRWGVLDADALGVGKGPIVRIVAMLTRMIDRGHGGVREEGIVYGNENVNVNDEDTGQPDG